MSGFLRGLLFWATAILVGMVLGVGSAFGVLFLGAQTAKVAAGQWSINTLAGSEAADPYTRALVARVGLLALAKSETIYFQLSSDETGEPLRESCVYELTGAAQPARWWSVTIYAAENYLPRNDDDAFSVDATSAAKDAQGAWTARIASEREDAPNWISSRGAEDGFILTLRLYNPTNEARSDPSTVPAPRIRTISCPEVAP